MVKRTTELRRQIAELAARVAHLVGQAKVVEAGQADVKRRFDGDDQYRGREETLKFQPSAAVGYWREAREQEVRLDAKRAELRGLEELGCGGAPLQVFIHYDEPPQCA